MDFQDFFKLAMDREIPDLVPNAWHGDIVLNLGDQLDH